MAWINNPWVWLGIAGVVIFVIGVVGSRKPDRYGQKGDNALAWTLWVMAPGLLAAVVGLAGAVFTRLPSQLGGS